MPILEIFVSPDQQWAAQHPKCPAPHLDSVWISAPHTRCWGWTGVSQLPPLKQMWPDQGLQREGCRWSAYLLPNSLRICCVSSIYFQGFPGGASDKEPAEDVRDLHSVSGLGRSPGGGHGNPLWHSFLENPMDRGDWQATVHRVTKSRTQLKWLRRKAHYIFSGLHMTRSSLSLTKPLCRIE